MEIRWIPCLWLVNFKESNVGSPLQSFFREGAVNDSGPALL